jgi:predicted amidophosphoribosyltransferase
LSNFLNVAFDSLRRSARDAARLALVESAARAIVGARLQTATPMPAHVLAMPLAAQRQRGRGFNQAVAIARAVARATAPQAASSTDECATNIGGALARSVDLMGLDVAIVDDARTTGATLRECARTLRAAGAKRVEHWVVARTPPPIR